MEGKAECAEWLGLRIWQEFGNIPHKILSTLLPAGPGAADSIASRIPPGLGLASGVLAVWGLSGLVCLIGLVCLAGFVCLAGLVCLGGWLCLSGYFFLKLDHLGIIFVSSIFEFRDHFLMKLRSGGLIFEGLGSLF